MTKPEKHRTGKSTSGGYDLDTASSLLGYILRCFGHLNGRGIARPRILSFYPD